MTRGADAIECEFRIWVDGRLSDHFADGLAGVDQRDDAAGTVLRGDHADDAHLQGVLDELRGLGIGVRRFEVTAKAIDEGSRAEDKFSRAPAMGSSPTRGEGRADSAESARSEP